MIALGAMIELLIELEQLGMFELEYRVNFQGFEDDPDTACAHFTFQKLMPIDLAIFMTLLTQARVHRSEFIQNDLLPELVLRPPISNRFRIYHLNKVGKSFVDTITELESSLWTDKQLLRDFLEWTHWSHADYLKKRSGLYWKDLGMNPVESLALPALKIERFFKLDFLRFFLRRPAIWSLQRNLNSSEGLLAICGKINHKMDYIEIGKTFTDLRLALASQGRVLQPYSLSTLPFIFSKFSNSPVDVNKYHFKIQDLLHNTLRIPNNEDIIWIFRYGHAKTQSPTLRKDIEDVTTWIPKD